MSDESIRKPDLDAAILKKEKFYLSMVLIVILVLALSAIGLMALMNFNIIHK